MTIEELTVSEQPPMPRELDRLRAEVVELRRDKERLLNAVDTLKRAKGRHNTGSAYQRLIDEFNSISSSEQAKGGQ